MEPRQTPEEVAEGVLSDHGYADPASGEYGECFCGRVFADAYDMAAHQVDRLKDAGLMIGFSTATQPDAPGWSTVQTILKQYAPSPMDPDCVQGKHKACGGTAWDTDKDEPTLCSCTCHKEER